MEFIVKKRLPAVYTELYEVNASDADEAERKVNGGSGMLTSRAFEVISPDDVKLGYVAEVLDNPDQLGVLVSNAPSSVDFLNGRFLDMPGKGEQRAIQFMDY